MPSAPSGAARDAVSLVSIFIIILGGLGLMLFVAALINDLAGGSERMMDALLQNLPADQQEKLAPLLAASRGGSKAGGIFFSLLCIGLAGFTIYGGLQMRALKNWGVALAAAILVMTPCSSYCCCCPFGLGVGIWALVMLTKPEVKSAFS